MKPRLRPFYPPTLNPLFVGSLQTIAPWLAHVAHRLDLTVNSEPSVQFRALQGKSCILLCNHPTFDDPIVMFLFSAYLGEPFYYMTAYEQFLSSWGWFYQQLGAYSVQRGLADRDSIAQTLQLLTQPRCKLVIFPEGGCSFQNDTVMPFRSGAVQIGLQAMTRCARRGLPVPDLHLVPISLKYRYTGRMAPVIEKTLTELERALGVTGLGEQTSKQTSEQTSKQTSEQPGDRTSEQSEQMDNHYQRLRTVAERILRQFEQEYDLVLPESADWNDRIPALKTTVLRRCEQALGLTSVPGEPNRERVYRIRHALDRQQTIALKGDPEKAGPENDWQSMSRAMMRILNFDATYDGYVAEKPTPERFLDTLVRFEREVFGIDKPRPKAHRQAFLHVGRPIRLTDHLEAYSRDRAGTITTLVQQLQQTIQHNLDILSEATARGISW